MQIIIKQTELNDQVKAATKQTDTEQKLTKITIQRQSFSMSFKQHISMFPFLRSLRKPHTSLSTTSGLGAATCPTRLTSPLFALFALARGY